MYQNYKPTYYYKNLFTINYKKLKENNIKCLLIDLDNTIAPTYIKTPSKEIIKLFKKLKKDFKLIIVSNSFKHRITPFEIELKIDACYFSSKPLKKTYKKILKKYNYKPEDVIAIGDQLITDIQGANKMGIKNILVDPIDPKESIITKINRKKEEKIFDFFAKNNYIKKGEYHE